MGTAHHGCSARAVPHACPQWPAEWILPTAAVFDTGGVIRTMQGHTGVAARFATVAQLAEQWFCKPQVNGSTPFGGFVPCCDILRREARAWGAAGGGWKAREVPPSVEGAIAPGVLRTSGSRGTRLKVGRDLRSMNIIFYALDSLRVDHVHAFGYARETTPVMDRLAAEGAAFELCYSQSGWTAPSAASVLSGQYPAATGIQKMRDRMSTETGDLSGMELEVVDHMRQRLATIAAGGSEELEPLDDETERRVREHRRSLGYLD